MKGLCQDMWEECVELARLSAGMAPAAWCWHTDFYGWTPFDEIAHLALFDKFALLAVGDAEQFLRERSVLEEKLAQGVEISEVAAQRYAALDGPALLQSWQEQCARLVGVLQTTDPKARVPWFGPDMSVRSFATARLMETWAHGQDIYDLLHCRRATTSRLCHIAHLGVATYQWTFSNRGLRQPGYRPYVELSACGAETWTWGEASAESFVRGTALDFCLVVTQRRHYTDTTLRVGGRVAREWLEIAQCFAGPPADGPGPGKRKSG